MITEVLIYPPPTNLAQKCIMNSHQEPRTSVDHRVIDCRLVYKQHGVPFFFFFFFFFFLGVSSLRWAHLQWLGVTISLIFDGF